MKCKKKLVDCKIASMRHICYDGIMKRTVLVTGASVGIGAAIAERFCRDGYQVALHYRSHKQEAEALCARLSAEGLIAAPFYADLQSEEDIDALAAAVRAQFGPVDVLVNNAGIALPAMLLQDLPPAEWDYLFSINVRGMYLVTRAVLPDMIGRQAGAVVNISSMWGVSGASCEAAYSASKAAVIGLTKALAKELAPSRIRVNCIAPGFVDTAMNGTLDSEARKTFIAETPLLRAGTAQDIASAAAFLASAEASFITGQTLSVDGGRCI